MRYERPDYHRAHPPTRQMPWQEPRTQPHPGQPHPQGRPYRPRHSGRQPMPPARRPSAFGRAIRGLAGALASGLLVLAIALIGVQYWATSNGLLGPGMNMLAGHLTAAVVALVAQAVADRSRGAASAIAVAAVYVVTAATLWIWWWA